MTLRHVNAFLITGPLWVESTIDHWFHYNGVIMSVMASQTTGVSIVYSAVVSSADQRKHQRSASLAFMRGFHRWPVNSPHKRPETRKMFPFDDVIMFNTLRPNDLMIPLNINQTRCRPLMRCLFYDQKHPRCGYHWFSSHLTETRWPTFSRRHLQLHSLNENVWISIKISLKFVAKDPIENTPALV